MKPVLIALYSPVMQSGKTEVADALVARKGYVRVKFADPLKRVLASLLREWGFPEEFIWRCLEGDLKETPIPGIGKSGRYLMQTLGTDWGRGLINPMLWIIPTYKTLRAHALEGRNVVVDDLRLPNELEMIKKVGGYPLRIIRPDAKPYSGHSSEGALDNIPMPELINSGTLAQLHQAALQLPEILAQ